MTLDAISAGISDGIRDLVQQVATLRDENIRLRCPWLPIGMAPETVFALWWVVPRSAADNHYTDTSGTPILAPPSKGRMTMGPRGSWSSLEKPTHWMPLPPPPRSAPNAAEQDTE